MHYNWGPHYIVPSPVLKSYSGIVQLREQLDRDLLQKEIQELGIPGNVFKISNPWYFREKGSGSWIKIGESADEHENFPVTWDTSKLKDGEYEVLGMMHVFVGEASSPKIIARQNSVEITIKN